MSKFDMDKALPAVPANVDGMVDIAVGLFNEARESYMGYAKRSLLFGWYIMKFSAAKEVQEKLKELNSNRRGRPWEAHNLAAEMIAAQAGERLPGSRWMKLCAQAVQKAQAQGLALEKIDNVRAFVEGIDTTKFINSLPDPLRSVAQGDGEHEDPDFEDFLNRTGSDIAKRIQRLVAKSEAERRRPSFSTLKKVVIEPVNKELEFLGLAIVPRQGGPKKSK
ncbi:MAG: hypothetical protein L6R28_25530 [Planctomycetes bacterium]|nr:hypothetical protein [Planctomycetota bacterium]